ncbi:hypothetical protein HBH46_153940 [Parastagonospora nodorum]|nr:hypothetical protein HBH46_153940 [Parastagonospora nodorum]KAH6456109.1 hypothetical protein HBI57_127120 [Parastagonospora nodorum]KAH6477083.1 hypothetical protein HBI58_104150 [Parastagonospora nodorum]
MAPHKYAVTRSTQKSLKDYQLAVSIGAAKFDLNPFVEDGDCADEEIQANNKKAAKLRAELHLLKSGNPSHPLVQLQEKADAVSKMVRLVTKQDVNAKSKEPHEQVEVVSHEFEQSQQRSQGLQERHQDLQRMCSDLYQVIEGESTTEQPRSSIAQLQKEAGSVGLLYKASQYDELRSWLEGLGGREAVEEAVSQAASVIPLLEKISGADGLQSQVLRAASVTPVMERLTGTELQTMEQLLRDHGGLTGVQKKVAQAVSVAPLLGGIQSDALQGFVDETIKVYADYGGIEGLRKELDSVSELDEVVNNMFDHLAKVESGLGPDFHNFSKAWLKRVHQQGARGKVAPEVQRILADERKLAEKFEEQCVVANQVAADLDQLRKQYALLLEQIKDKDKAIALYRGDVDG